MDVAEEVAAQLVELLVRAGAPWWAWLVAALAGAVLLVLVRHLPELRLPRPSPAPEPLSDDGRPADVPPGVLTDSAGVPVTGDPDHPGGENGGGSG